MRKVQEQCLSCKFFRLKDVQTGICRINKKLDPVCPAKQIEDCCDKWKNCGQQYFIRLGWLKNKKG